MNEVNYDINHVEYLNVYTKKRIMDFFNRVKCDEIGASTMPIVDEITKREITDYYIQQRAVPSAFYRKGTFIWRSELVYHFDKYNVKLDPDFMNYILRYNDLLITNQQDEQG